MSNYYLFTNDSNIEFNIQNKNVTIKIEKNIANISLEKLQTELTKLNNYLRRLETCRKKNN